VSQMNRCGVATKWVSDNTVGYEIQYREELRRQVRRCVDQADRHTLKLIQKFVRSLER